MKHYKIVLEGALDEVEKTIASASTISLTDGKVFNVTGNTAITAINIPEGATRTLKFAGSLVLTHSSGLQLFTGSNITTQAGDIAHFQGVSGGAIMIGYFKKNGEALVGSGGGGGLALTGQNYVLVQSVNTGNPSADAITNGEALKQALLDADALDIGAKSEDNLAVVLLMPGTYDANGTPFTVPTFVDIVGISSNAKDTILMNSNGDYTLQYNENVNSGLFNVDIRQGSTCTIYDNGETGQYYRWDNVVISGDVTPSDGSMNEFKGKFRRVTGTAIAFAYLNGDIDIDFEGEVDFLGSDNILRAGNDFNGAVKGNFGNFGGGCFRANNDFNGTVKGTLGDFGVGCFGAVNDFNGTVKGTFGDFGDNCFRANNGNFSGTLEGNFGDFGNDCFYAGNTFNGTLEGTFGDFGTNCLEGATLTPKIINANIPASSSSYNSGTIIRNSIIRGNVDIQGNVIIEYSKILGNITGSASNAQIIFNAVKGAIDNFINSIISNNIENLSIE
jgi:hypothetical protein